MSAVTLHCCSLLLHPFTSTNDADIQFNLFATKTAFPQAFIEAFVVAGRTAHMKAAGGD